MLSTNELGVDTFDGAPCSVSTLSILRASDRKVEWVDFAILSFRMIAPILYLYCKASF